MSILKDIVTTLRGGINVAQYGDVVRARKTLAAAGDYAVEDVFSESATDGLGTAWRFDNVARTPGGIFSVTQAGVLCSTTGLTPIIVLYLFTRTPTSELDDNAANTAVVAADVPFYVGHIEFPAMSDLGGHSEALAMLDTGSNLPLEGKCASKSTSLYGIAVTKDAIAGEAAGMTLSFALFVHQGLGG